MLNQPAWQPLNIAGYFFLGGLAGAGSVLAAGAELSGRPVMARALKVTSTVSVAGSTAALIHDLGRPGRFANMLRVFKPTSPMSVGSWLLAAYAPASVVATPVRRRRDSFRASAVRPRWERRCSDRLSPSYTAVLAADTAVPGWHEGYRELPFVFVGSAATAASGMALAASPLAENGPARSAAVAGTALENAASQGRWNAGSVWWPRSTAKGRGGRWMRAAEALSRRALPVPRCSEGAAAPRPASSGLALLAASACTRFGVFHAGMASSKDPKYTVVPQRERLPEREGTRGGQRRGAGREARRGAVVTQG